MIIEQSPIFDENATEAVKLEEGDTVTIYIPDVSETYPDMVAEGWTLSEAEAFAQEYGVTLDIENVDLFKNIIEKVIHFDNVTIELKGLKENCEYIFTDVENEKSFKGSDKLKITLSEKRTSVIYEYKIEG